MHATILNTDRIVLDNFVEKFGPDGVLETLRSLFLEKAKENRRTFEERQHLETVLSSQSLPMKDQMRHLFDEYGKERMITTLVSITVDLENESSTHAQKRGALRMRAALEMATMKKAWGRS